VDKILHLIGGMALAILVIVGSFSISDSYDIPVDKFVIVGAGAATGIIGGILKEVWDGMGHGTVEVEDLIASSIGAVSASAILLLLLP